MNQDQARLKLTARREELLGQIGKIEADIRHVKEPVEKDSQERSVQRENDDVLDALDEAGRDELTSIDRALARIEAGTYGTCATCGEGIGRARLVAVPAADECIRCAETAE